MDLGMSREDTAAGMQEVERSRMLEPRSPERLLRVGTVKFVLGHDYMDVEGRERREARSLGNCSGYYSTSYIPIVVPLGYTFSRSPERLPKVGTM